MTDKTEPFPGLPDYGYESAKARDVVVDLFTDRNASPDMAYVMPVMTVDGLEWHVSYRGTSLVAFYGLAMARACRDRIVREATSYRNEAGLYT